MPLAKSQPEIPSGAASARDGWWTRDHVLVLVLVAVTAIFLFLCYRIAEPFLSPLAWAVALAVVAHPLHAWIGAKLKKPDLAAGVAVALVALVVLAPFALVMQQIGREAGKVIEAAQSGGMLQQWQAAAQSHPQLAPALRWAQSQIQPGQQLAQGVGSLRSLLAGSLWAAVELLLTLFFLFFLFRDRREALDALRSLVPLSEGEADRVFGRVADTIHATVYGTLTVAAVQGALGGLMFWWLGLPAPLLWGVVMGILAVVPVLGAFVVWVPAAIYLAVTGMWGKAVILVAWGAVVVGLVDNLLYPVLVGNRLRLHTVPVFVAIIGGLSLFGASGLILGPVILAVTHALIEIWRRRTRDGKPAEAAVGKAEPTAPPKETLRHA
jgi:predicted PurR-regulated permease PerM